jgi:septal ring factor EnvC (AmiA/AmiB activator)
MSDAEKEFEEWWAKEFWNCPPTTGAAPWAKQAYLAAYQKQEERIKQIQSHANHLGDCIHGQTMMRLGLEAQLEQAKASNKQLREAIERHRDTVRSWHTDIFPEDEELYAVLDAEKEKP